MSLKTVCLAVLMLQCFSVKAAEKVIWQGSEKFSGWSDALSIEGSKFSDAKADDVLCLSITASGGAQLQLSWGSSWTCFDGLQCLDISGNYEMLLTSENASRLKSGLHIKGVNYTLTAVTLKSNDGVYETKSPDFFSWDDMLLSGATQGESCTVGLKAYGGSGWYWPESKDMSSYAGILIELLEPAAETMTAQLLYNDKSVKSLTIAKGATSCKLTLTSLYKKVYSVNIISEKSQTVSVGSVNFVDKEGRVVPSAIGNVSAEGKILSVEYYNTAGVRQDCMHSGINIIRTNYNGGRTTVRKEIR